MPYKRLLIGTGNEGKKQFTMGLLEPLPLQMLGIQDLGIDIQIEETGTTPEENARIKAQEYFAAAKIPTLSGDSGLYIEGLPEEEQPGIFVRRISGSRELSEDEVLRHYAKQIEKC